MLRDPIMTEHRGVRVYQIVYISRAVAKWSDAALDRLAEISTDRNGRAGVTGLLLYDGTRFLQALEGDEGEVRATMERIAGDDRHDTIQYLAHGPASRRQFGDWAMQVKRAPDNCCSNEFLARVKQDVNAVQDAHLRAAFIGFAALAPNQPEGYVCST